MAKHKGWAVKVGGYEYKNKYGKTVHVKHYGRKRPKRRQK